ncbi:unnamed protein product, partial [Mesorhabditis spiculigera]
MFVFQALQHFSAVIEAAVSGQSLQLSPMDRHMQMQHAAANAYAAAQAVRSVLPQQLGFTGGPSPIFPLDLLQTPAATLHPASLFVPHTAYLLPSTQAFQAVPPASPATLHSPPVNTQPAVQQVTHPVAQNPPAQQQIVQQHQQPHPSNSQQTIQNTPSHAPVISLPPGPVAPALPPTMPHSMRSLTMRLKRTAPQHSQIARLSSKVRRVEGRPSTDAELSPSEPPSTSQLTRPQSLGLGQLCTNCQDGTRSSTCLSCVPCHHCVVCQHHQAASASASAQPQQSLAVPQLSATMSAQAHSLLSALQAAPPAQQSSSPTQQIAALAAQQDLIQTISRERMNAAIWSRQLQAYDTTNTAAFNQRLAAPYTLSQLSLTGHPGHLLVVPRAGTIPIQNARLDLVFTTLPSEVMYERPTMERQHATAVFGGQPVAEPQPIGASLDDIEKNTQRSEFVKDLEIPENEKERCTVCLMDFESGDGVRTLRCEHLFHVDCIDKWLVYNKKCPVCRVEVDCPKAALLVE